MSTYIFAHRGASHLAPENTMPAFQLAYEQGADGIETDVHLTKDQIPVLIHDEHLKRTTNGSGYIKDYTFSELKQFDAGSWFSDDFAGARMISLDEFLKWSKSKELRLNIELKNNKFDYEHLETITYEMIMNHQLQNQTVISTFNPNSVERMNKFSHIEIAWLTSKSNRNLVKNAKKMGAHALHIKYPLLKTKLMKQAHKNGLAVRVFTINKQSHMMNCFKHECAGIFTDVPALALKQRNIYLKENI